MADTPLDSIIATAAQAPPDLPRLTVANTFITYSRLGTALERATIAYRAIPSATPDGCNQELKEIVKSLESATANANRLLEANR